MQSYVSNPTPHCHINFFWYHFWCPGCAQTHGISYKLIKTNYTYRHFITISHNYMDSYYGNIIIIFTNLAIIQLFISVFGLVHSPIDSLLANKIPINLAHRFPHILLVQIHPALLLVIQLYISHASPICLFIAGCKKKSYGPSSCFSICWFKFIPQDILRFMLHFFPHQPFPLLLLVI